LRKTVLFLNRDFSLVVRGAHCVVFGLNKVVGKQKVGAEWGMNVAVNKM